jgi:hypothetical protein
MNAAEPYGHSSSAAGCAGAQHPQIGLPRMSTRTSTRRRLSAWILRHSSGTVESRVNAFFEVNRTIRALPTNCSGGRWWNGATRRGSTCFTSTARWSRVGCGGAVRSAALARAANTSSVRCSPVSGRRSRQSVFAAFPTLGSLLHYLHLCATCVVIDCARAQSWAEIVPDNRARVRDQVLDAPDEEAINRVTREEFWRSIDALLMCDAERFVLYHSFIMGRKPGEIYKMRRDLFGSVAEVYNVKRNILGRLSRNRELRRLAGMPASS